MLCGKFNYLATNTTDTSNLLNNFFSKYLEFIEEDYNVKIPIKDIVWSNILNLEWENKRAYISDWEHSKILALLSHKNAFLIAEILAYVLACNRRLDLFTKIFIMQLDRVMKSWAYF